MSYHFPRILPAGETRKRKERESFYSAAPGAITKTTTPRPFVRPSTAQAVGKAKPAEEKGANRLLAGYMAHEFLTKGTLLGQAFDPPRLEAAGPFPGKPGAEPRRAKPEAEPSGGARKVGDEEHASYADVAGILKSDGAHIPGIVNPTQLARWIHQT